MKNIKLNILLPLRRFPPNIRVRVGMAASLEKRERERERERRKVRNFIS
jgi:hypothetical protein